MNTTASRESSYKYMRLLVKDKQRTHWTETTLSTVTENNYILLVHSTEDSKNTHKALQKSTCL